MAGQEQDVVVGGGTSDGSSAAHKRRTVAAVAASGTGNQELLGTTSQPQQIVDLSREKESLGESQDSIKENQITPSRNQRQAQAVDDVGSSNNDKSRIGENDYSEVPAGSNLQDLLLRGPPVVPTAMEEEGDEFSNSRQQVDEGNDDDDDDDDDHGVGGDDDDDDHGVGGDDGDDDDDHGVGGDDQDDDDGSSNTGDDDDYKAPAAEDLGAAVPSAPSAPEITTVPVPVSPEDQQGGAPPASGAPVSDPAPVVPPGGGGENPSSAAGWGPTPGNSPFDGDYVPPQNPGNGGSQQQQPPPWSTPGIPAVPTASVPVPSYGGGNPLQPAYGAGGNPLQPQQPVPEYPSPGGWQPDGSVPTPGGGWQPPDDAPVWGGVPHTQLVPYNSPYEAPSDPTSQMKRPDEPGNFPPHQSPESPPRHEPANFPPHQSPTKTTKSQHEKVPWDLNNCSARQTFSGRNTCRLLGSMWHHPLSWVVVFLSVYAVHLIRKQRQRQHALSARGEYRQVAARYADTAFDDTYSPIENADYMSDEEDDGGGANGNGSIQMKSFGRDKLGLREVNG